MHAWLFQKPILIVAVMFLLQRIIGSQLQWPFLKLFLIAKKKIICQRGQWKAKAWGFVQLFVTSVLGFMYYPKKITMPLHLFTLKWVIKIKQLFAGGSGTQGGRQDKTKLRTAILRPNLLFMRVSVEIRNTNKQEHLLTVIIATAGALVVVGV